MDSFNLVALLTTVMEDARARVGHVNVLIAAVDDLQVAGYIQPTSSKCTLYRVTREGRLAVKELKGGPHEGA